MQKFLRIAVFMAALCGLVYLVRVNQSDVSAFSQAVKQMGYDDVSETPYEVVEFTVPKEFNAVYQRYNNLLKEGGYDLSPYKGRTCKRYTYLIPSQNARANIIVCDGKIIGGDISSITLDGIMIPIRNNSD